LIGSHRRQCEKAILEAPRQIAMVLQGLGGLSLGIQLALYSLDDFVAIDQEQLQKRGMRLKRYVATTFCCHPTPPR
jgi:hypothetical protein